MPKRPDDAAWPEWADFYFQAWQRLDTDRPAGFAGIMPIPFASLDRYATRYGIEGADFEVFVKLLAAIDAAFIAAMNEKKAKEGAGHGYAS